MRLIVSTHTLKFASAADIVGTAAATMVMQQCFVALPPNLVGKGPKKAK